MSVCLSFIKATLAVTFFMLYGTTHFTGTVITLRVDVGRGGLRWESRADWKRTEGKAMGGYEL